MRCILRQPKANFAIAKFGFNLIFAFGLDGSCHKFYPALRTAEHRPRLNPDYAIENLLRAEIAANTAISSYFLFTVGVATFSKKILAGIPVFIALSTLVTIPIV